MKSVSHAAATALVLAAILNPVSARADGLCDKLGEAVKLAKTGFGPVQGEPLSSNDSQYWRSTIQLSAGDNCAIEGRRILSCSWEPSTEDDLKTMVAAVAACFPGAQRDVITADDEGPPETSFKLDQASIEIGLTADVLTLNVGP